MQLDMMNKKTDESTVVDVADMDFSMTFDKVPHGMLDRKVRSQGIKMHI